MDGLGASYLSDIAAAAVFLASEDAVYITGSTVRVDGGRMAIG